MSEQLTMKKSRSWVPVAILWAVAVLSWPALALLSDATGGEFQEPLQLGPLSFVSWGAVGAGVFLVTFPVALAATVAWAMWRAPVDGPKRISVAGHFLRALATLGTAFGGYMAANVLVLLLYPLLG